MPADMSHLPVSTRRTFLSLVGALGIGGALAACGGDTGGLDSGGGSGGGKPTLKQWYHLYGESGTEQAVQRYAQGYERATVEVQWTPGDYESKLSSGLLSDSGPDVFEYQLNVDMVRSGQIVPLDDIVGPVRGDYTDTDVTATSLDGSIYGVKIVDDTGFLYYRKSLLAAAGVQPPTTMDELIDASRALNRDGVKGLFIGNDAGVTPAFGGGALLDLVLWSAGTANLTADNRIGFTTPEAKDSFRKLRELAESGSILLGAPTDFWDPSAFTQELAAMQWCGLWAMPKIKEAFGDDFGIVPWPALSATVGKPVTFLGGWTSFVSAKARDVDLAKDFVKWLWIDNAEAQEDFNLSYGFHIPPRKSLAASAQKLQEGVAAEALRIFNESAVAPNPMWTPKMKSAFADAATAIVRGGGDIDAELAKAQQAVEAELARLAA
ncbi:multiple sugar transport system substrate-binding protein [Pseudonocardia hierapolitana]|uniref:Multiple sugar transport system substrate-binding protein n=1 Tax=Pseudonocardia hierapolitana TaxID=1128676 RepID=A0A561SKP3_9PSEU|nr:extracellular solute-binding protein [Pseudonocardia hierapolitana]TWF75436.1 multiple sugar transport system substrate-binding protein [Pseudonocardia hierapolitana]